MSPISVRRYLKDHVEKLNPLRPDITQAEYDRRILHAAKIASMLVLVLLVLSLIVQLSH